jgi:NAD(P)-dependent dehydrogenase (short-subunit alcohol dehydrogenase family)
MTRYLDRVAVVTGGASGLGEATARLLAAEGGRVVIADLHLDRARAVATSIGSDRASAVECDVTDEADVAAAFDHAVATFGGVDGAFANAGIVGAAGPIADTPMEHYDRTMAVLLRGVFCTIKHASRTMRDGGGIVCTSSVAGVMGGLGPHVYAAAKAGVIGLARSAAAELARRQIRVNAVAPGSIPTAMTAHVMSGDPDAIERITESIGSRSPLGRSGTPTDIAETVLFLLSDAGSYITGQCLVVDAGVTSGASMSPTWASSAMVEARPAT